MRRKKSSPKPREFKSKSCVHHWVIDQVDQGVCRRCGAKRDFRALQERELHRRKDIMLSAQSAGGKITHKRKQTATLQ